MLCYIFIQYIWRDFDITGFKIKHRVHIISRWALSSLKNSWWSSVIQLIHTRNLWYYHCHINHWPDLQASLTQQCQAVHYDHCPRLLIFHTYFSAGRPPNAAALNAVRSLIQCGVSLGEISGSYQLTGHRNVGSTSCPGNSLYSEIGTWPNWNPNPTSVAGEPLPYIRWEVKEGPLSDDSV
jgi:hypothetical protein